MAHPRVPETTVRNVSPGTSSDHREPAWNSRNGPRSWCYQLTLLSSFCWKRVLPQLWLGTSSLLFHGKDRFATTGSIHPRLVRYQEPQNNLLQIVANAGSSELSIDTGSFSVNDLENFVLHGTYA